MQFVEGTLAAHHSAWMWYLTQYCTLRLLYEFWWFEKLFSVFVVIFNLHKYSLLALQIHSGSGSCTQFWTCISTVTQSTTNFLGRKWHIYFLRTNRNDRAVLTTIFADNQNKFTHFRNFFGFHANTFLLLLCYCCNQNQMYLKWNISRVIKNISYAHQFESIHNVTIFLYNCTSFSVILCAQWWYTRLEAWLSAGKIIGQAPNRGLCRKGGLGLSSMTSLPYLLS